MEQQTGTKLGKEYVKAVYHHPAFFNLYAEYIMRNAGLEETQAGIKISGRNINNLTYADDTTLVAESERRTKGTLDESERGEWKSWLKIQHYTSVSLLLSRTQGYCYHLSKFHVYALVYCIGVFLSGLLHSV